MQVLTHFNDTNTHNINTHSFAVFNPIMTNIDTESPQFNDMKSEQSVSRLTTYCDPLGRGAQITIIVSITAYDSV